MSNFEPEPYQEELELKELDVWSIIETYFRDNPNYKSQHQVDSFNEFIHSKTNGIEYIIKRENPQIIYKEAIDADKGKYRYQINLYYGETLNDDGSVNNKIIDNLFISDASILPSNIGESPQGTIMIFANYIANKFIEMYL